ncbi:MAG: hypothetical protein ISS45_11900, partial [Candidatus Omnitrophica bacterium]|nr:hypothetical protein [Candidatus Omnitrophota bacterium]
TTHTLKDFGAGADYYNLTINDTSATNSDTFQLGAALNVDGNLTITDGTFDVSATNYQINLAGNWSKAAAGAFTQQSGTVVLDGTNQTISGSTTFNNFSKTDATDNATDLILTFDNTGTQTISGLLTLDGLDDTDRVNLVSDSPGTQWSLICNGTFAIDYVDVTDSDASGGTTVSHTNTVNGGNNLNWGFPSADNAPFFGANF